ncbi:MAG: response regulator [Candidatus Nitrosotenuis sp.]|nr:MAG: response regulator [Candidatus Nitrosotenuis sp.]
MLLTYFVTHDRLTSAIIIDDDRDTVDVFVDYMEILNVNVLARGYGGKDAVELYERYRPDIVFLDLMMADYDGFYALERIRKINPDAKVIIVTADLRRDSELRLSELKPTEVLFKPFAPELLEEIVKKYKSA